MQPPNQQLFSVNKVESDTKEGNFLMKACFGVTNTAPSSSSGKTEAGFLGDAILWVTPIS